MAMAIFAGGIVGVLSVFSVATRSNANALRLEQAVHIAERELILAIAAGEEQLVDRESKEGIYSYSLKYQSKPHDLMAAMISVHWLQQGKKERFQMTRVFKPRKKEG